MLELCCKRQNRTIKNNTTTGAHAASLNTFGKPVSNKSATTSAVLPTITLPPVSSTQVATAIPSISTGQVSLPVGLYGTIPGL